MKLIGRIFFLSAILSAAAVWATESNDPLFNSNEFTGSTFGESANGNIDSQPTSNTIHTTTTTTTTTTVVAAPTAVASPSVSPDPPPEEEAVKKHAKAFAKAAGPKGTDPKVTKVTKHTRVVSHDRIEHNAGGGGIQFTYFFTRYIGVALEGDFLGGNPYNTAVTGNLIFRYPFEFGAKTETSGYSKDGKSVVDGKDGKTVVTGPTWGLAPYAIAGGGGQWDGHGEGVGVIGGGLEFRFKQHYGVFVEGRWVIHDARQNYAAETAGFVYSF